MKLEIFALGLGIAIWAFGAWTDPAVVPLHSLSIFESDWMSVVRVALGIPAGVLGLWLLSAPFWNKRRYW